MVLDIYKISTEANLKISCLKDDIIYNVDSNRIYQRSIFDFDNPLLLDISTEEEIDGIYAVENLLVVICMNVVYSYEIGSWELKSRDILPGSIRRVREGKDGLFFLLENDKIISLGNSTIFLFRKGNYSKNEYLVDFCLSGGFFFFLSQEGCVYKSISKEMILLNKPLKIIPEPSSTPYSIYYSDRKIFLGYADGVEAYTLTGDILHLLYRYNTKYYKLVEDTGLYCLDGTVNLLGDYPGVVLNDLVQYMLGNVCISKEYLYVLEDPSSTNTSSTTSNNDSIYTSSDNVNLKIQNLFADLRSNFSVEGTEKKKVLEDFDQAVLNKYRRFYLELKTVNDSILQKKEKLDRLEKKILEKSIALEEKRNKLSERFRKAKSKYLENVKIDGRRIKEYIGILEEKLKNKDKGEANQKYKSLLKTQRNLLIEKLTKE